MSKPLPVRIELDSVRLLNRSSLPRATERATTAHYKIIYAPNVNPYTIEFTSLENPDEVYLVPIQNCLHLKVAKASQNVHQPLGTHENYDTPTGVRRNFGRTKEKVNAPKKTK